MLILQRAFRVRQIAAIVCLTILSSVTLPGSHLNPVVVKNISVGQSPQGVAVNPVTNRIYVANGDFDTVAVIDGTTDTVVDTIAVGNQPVGVAVDTVANRIYVANYSGDTVSVIDGNTDLVAATIPTSSRPLGIGVNADTNRVYVSNLGSNLVSVIDGATDTVLTTIPVGQTPYGVAVNPVTNRVYVANYSSGSLSVIDGSSNTVTTTLSDLVVWPTGVAVNPITNRVYVSSWILQAPVKVIDGETNTVTATVVPGQNRALGITVDSARNVIHVAYRWGGGSGGSLASIDGDTNTVSSNLFICCNGAPLYADVNPVTDRVYVSLPGWCCNPADAHWVAVVADRPPAANVAISMTDSPDPIRWVDDLTYTMHVFNYGPDAATDVTVTDTLPASAAFISASPGCVYHQTTHTVSCDLDTMPAGSYNVLTIVVQPLQGGTLTNTATVATTMPDPDMPNNVASATTTVQGPPNAPPACGQVPPEAKPPICP